MVGNRQAKNLCKGLRVSGKKDYINPKSQFRKVKVIKNNDPKVLASEVRLN